MHLGFLSLHESGFRRFGGVGLGLEEPRVEITATQSRDKQCTFRYADDEIASEDQSRLQRDILRSMSELQINCSIQFTIKNAPGAHRGLGSGTSIRLAAIEAALLLTDTPISEEGIIVASRRGGASGIGVRTYFEGGFWLDLGHSSDARPFVPSAFKDPGISSSIALPRLGIPKWSIVLARSKNSSSLSGAEELDFFNRVLPLPEAESHRATYIGLFGLYASILSGDFEKFSEAINAMQETLWKKEEWGANDTSVSFLADRFLQAGAPCVGLSSLGPTIFSVFETMKEAQNLVEKLDNCVATITRFANSGRRISNVSD